MQVSDHLKKTLATLPDKPGCYLMKDAAGKIIYAGKAVNLKNRVRSYFHASAGHDRKYSTICPTSLLAKYTPCPFE